MSIPLFGEPLQTELPQRTLLLIARFGFSVMLILTPLIFMLFHRKPFISTQLIFTLHRRMLFLRKLFISTSFILKTSRLTLHRFMQLIFTLHRLTLFIFMLLILTPLRFKQHRR